jgi:hypothetical protein
MWMVHTKPGWENGFYREDLNNFFMDSEPEMVCDCIQRLANWFQQYQEESGTPIIYQLVPGPNSNTFISHIVRACGIDARPPFRATFMEGWDWGIYDNSTFPF